MSYFHLNINKVADMLKKTVSLIRKTAAYAGFFKINNYTVQYTTPAGEMSEEITLSCFERGHAAAILIYDPKHDAALMFEEFRIGNYVADPKHAWSIGPVAGGIEPGEGALASAIREAREEAGIIIDPKNVIGPMVFYPSCGGSSEQVSLYLAVADFDRINPALKDLDPGEYTEAKIVSRTELMRMAFDTTNPAPVTLTLGALWLEREIATLKQLIPEEA